MGDLGKRNPNEVFMRTYPGTYSPSKIFDGTPWDTKEMPELMDSQEGQFNQYLVPYKEFIFTYVDCKNTTLTVKDTIFLIRAVGDWGSDTVVYCRDSSSISLLRLFNDPMIDYPSIGFKPDLFPGGSVTATYWYDRGINYPDSYAPGTISGYPSLPEGSNKVNSDDMNSNIGYHYQWKPESGGIYCLFTSMDGIPDSGIMVVILKDPAVAQDYTAQLCKNSYDEYNTHFDLNAYTGLSVKWERPKSGGYANGLNDDNHKVDVFGSDHGTQKEYGLQRGVYKYAYTLPADCGPGGTGVLYLKVTNNIKVPQSKTVKFCISKLPASINVNNIFGIADRNLTWSPPQNVTYEGFNADTGVLDIAKYFSANEAVAQDLTFTSGGTGCVPAGKTVTISFVTSL
jgi:hypothetical protein